MIRGVRLLAVITGAYIVFWIAAEGELYRAVIMAFLVTALTIGLLTERYLGGRSFTVRKWIFSLAGMGAIAGVSIALLTLVFMAVKTGLHGHGPEFTRDQLEWVLMQIPIWGVAGLIGGLGLGLITAKRSGSG
ncbi:MAG TPA: hypothetical protein VFI27_12465 [candidate division Zixibacteria bacterium]|nr:hypothetical protein [candidate division Zixibacteria bacterium]